MQGEDFGLLVYCTLPGTSMAPVYSRFSVSVGEWRDSHPRGRTITERFKMVSEGWLEDSLGALSAHALMDQRTLGFEGQVLTAALCLHVRALL